MKSSTQAMRDMIEEGNKKIQKLEDELYKTAETRGDQAKKL
jgi:hypothetical protein